MNEVQLVRGYEVVIGLENHVQRGVNRFWRGCQHPGQRRGPGFARHAARAQPGCG
jgi:hypothetical protein